MADRVSDQVNSLIGGMLRQAYQGEYYEVECVLCMAEFDGRDAFECEDGPLCVLCAMHPRFDLDTCPRCGAAWSDTVKPCDGCGMTVKAVKGESRSASPPPGEHR